MAPSDKKSGGSPQAATAKKPAGAKTGVGESAPAGKRKPAGPPPGFAVAAAPAPAHETTGAKTGRKSSTGGSRRSSEARRTSLGHQSGSPQVIGENAASASGTPRLLICLFGPPCSGKGTLAALMKEQLRVAHFSTGELLRQAATQEGENSEVGAALKAGKLVEDRVIVRVLKEAMEKNPQERGAILDGFPRNESQVDMLREMNLWPDVSFFIRVPSDTLFKRMANRRVDPVTGEVFGLGAEPANEEQKRRLVRREDDSDEILQNRIRDFEANMEKISMKMQNHGEQPADSHKREDCAATETTAKTSRLIDVDGDRPIQEVFEEIVKHLKTSFPGVFQS